MADAPGTPSVSSSAPSTPPSSAADQARIRKERREAKIKAGGSARLDRITGLGGGVKRDAPPQPTATAAADPDEVDISQHYYEPAPRGRPSQTPVQAQQSQQINDEALRQMMLGFDPSTPPGGPGGPGANPFAGFPGLGGMGQMPGAGGAPDAEDPMMKMLQQMMGGVPGEGAGGMPSFPGMGGMPGMPGQGQAVGTADPYAYIWRLLHAIFALCLGLYIAFTTPFTGTKLARLASATSESSLTPASTNFFWIFATAELILQSSRFFLEKGRGPQYEGIVGMVVGFLPQPWKGYVDTLGRYGRIWTTVTRDAFVCVFVLGICAWLRGAA